MCNFTIRHADMCLIQPKLTTKNHACFVLVVDLQPKLTACILYLLATIVATVRKEILCFSKRVLSSSFAAVI
jgi:hypothetical protein